MGQTIAAMRRRVITIFVLFCMLFFFAELLLLSLLFHLAPEERPFLPLVDSNDQLTAAAAPPSGN